MKVEIRIKAKITLLIAAAYISLVAVINENTPNYKVRDILAATGHKFLVAVSKENFRVLRSKIKIVSRQVKNALPPRASLNLNLNLILNSFVQDLKGLIDRYVRLGFNYDFTEIRKQF